MRVSWLGHAALVVWAVHALDLVRRGDAADLLWICNLAGILLAVGCWCRSALPVAMGLLWLGFGTPLWLVEVLGHPGAMITSFASHLGGITIGMLAVRRLGWPRGAWWKAALALPVPFFAARLFTAPARNVNLAFDVWRGWETYFPTHRVYVALVFAAGALVFLGLSVLLRRLAPGDKNPR